MNEGMQLNSHLRAIEAHVFIAFTTENPSQHRHIPTDLCQLRKVHSTIDPDSVPTLIPEAGAHVVPPHPSLTHRVLQTEAGLRPLGQSRPIGVQNVVVSKHLHAVKMPVG